MVCCLYNFLLCLTDLYLFFQISIYRHVWKKDSYNEQVLTNTVDNKNWFIQKKCCVYKIPKCSLILYHYSVPGNFISDAYSKCKRGFQTSKNIKPPLPAEPTRSDHLLVSFPVFFKLNLKSGSEFIQI